MTMVEQTDSELNGELSTFTQESSEQLVRLLREPPKQKKQNEWFQGFLWWWLRQRHRREVRKFWRHTVFSIIQDCDPYNHDRFELRHLYGHIPKEKITARLIRLVYKAFRKTPKGLVEWYEGQGIPIKTLGIIEQELMGRVIARRTDTYQQAAA